MKKLVVNENGAGICECLDIPQQRMEEIFDKVVELNNEESTHTGTLQKAYDAFEDEKEKIIAVWLAGEMMGRGKTIQMIKEKGPLAFLPLICSPE